MTFEVPAGIPAEVYRVATSGRFNDSLHTIVTEWGLTDVWDANAYLDALEDAQAAARED